MAKTHETHNSKHKSGRNFEKKEYRKSNGDYWRRTWPASICPDTVRGYTVICTEFPSGWRALAFSKISSILSGLAPGLFQNFDKMHPDCYQASPTIGWGPLSAQRPPQGHHSLALGTVRTCPKVCLLSLVTDLLSESKISDKWSQVTPLSELIEMVQYYTKYSALTQENLSDSTWKWARKYRKKGGRERVSSNGESREYIPRAGIVVWAEGTKTNEVCWGMDGLVLNADRKPNATSPKSVKWVDQCPPEGR